MNEAPATPSFSYTLKPGWKLLMENSSSGHVLRKITIEGKELSSLPLEVFTFEEIQILKMSPERESCLSYRINFLPEQVGQLLNLRALYLDTHDLQEIPPEIGTLKNLRRLTLSNGSLTFLPSELGELQNLQSFHLANNNFKDFPSVICQFTNLTFLDVSDNKIETLPPNISNLKKLETFLLLFNCIQNLPDGFCCLTKLRCLWLGNNNLRELPRKFGNLTMLDWGHNYCSGNVEGNPLYHPPIEVCRGGPREIKEYFSHH
ncbi:hypothetical protein FKM82_005755 [Ascaphus truei]